MNKGIRIITNYGDNVPYINAVADQVKQVLLNLLNNAAYACHGGGTISIKTRVVEEKNVAIQVHDTGTGIKPEVIPHIYEPFFSTKPAVKGTGLGLSISYGILKEHGGSIDVQSEPGKGTTFTVSLPIQAASKRSNNKSGGA